QNDIKRVLAYSTVSQLGYMFLALGVGAFAAGVFHVFTHAFFKALLFLGAGSVIHAMSGEQDMRNMGDLHARTPVTHWTMFIATLAIAGIFPFAGFFSKDEILWQAWSSEGGAYRLLWLIGTVTAFMTSFYMFRLMFLTFHGRPRMSHEVEHHIHESPPSMTGPLVLLAIGSILAGSLGVRSDEILWQAWSSEGGAYRLLWLIGTVTAFMTSFYMFRLMFLTFHGRPRMSHEVEHHIHESPPSMTGPLVLLAIGSILAGSLGV